MFVDILASERRSPIVVSGFEFQYLCIEFSSEEEKNEPLK